MARRLFIFDAPDRFVAGSVGEPGSRAFFLQARKGGTVVSVALEKAQVAALAERLDSLLDAVEVPPAGTQRATSRLDEPVVELFQVGAMALAWDADDHSVVIEAQTPTEDGEYAEVNDDEPDGPDLLRVRLDPADARQFVRETEAVLRAGRPPCPFCGQPLDPQGHFCPRRNGQVH
jgi:uncharacterized repeat protein (TIGR03847 family)